MDQKKTEFGKNKCLHCLHMTKVINIQVVMCRQIAQKQVSTKCLQVSTKTLAATKCRHVDRM
jgi:hypothetical protein